MTVVSSRCLNCQAPIQFQPGAGSRLCPFCDTVNLVREQTISVPPKELQIDEVLILLQQGRGQQALEMAERLLAAGQGTVRLKLYRAQAMFVGGKVQEAVYHLVDLTGEDAPPPLRADIHARLAEILWAAGRLEEAAASAEKAQQLVRGHPGAVLVTVKWLLRQNRLEVAGQLAENTLRELSKPPKVTFPPPPLKFWLLLAHIRFAAGRVKETIDWLENMLLGQLFCPLPAVAEGLSLLGRALLRVEGGRVSALEFIRAAVLLEGEAAEAGKLLREALENEGEDWDRELELLQQSRQQWRQQVAQALAQRIKIAPEQLDRSWELFSLGKDADSRVDVLQALAVSLGVERYDRGSLYPLRTIDDFCRWLEAARARRLLARIRWERQEKERLDKLRELQKKSSSTLPRAAPHRLQRRSRWPVALWLAGAGLLGLVAVFLAAYGDRWLCEFRGTLRAVECDRLGQECWLVVDGGEEARKRFESNRLLPAWKRWYALWRDQKLGRDGLWYYTLQFPWGRLPADSFRSCIGASWRRSVSVTLRAVLKPDQRAKVASIRETAGHRNRTDCRRKCLL